MLHEYLIYIGTCFRDVPTGLLVGLAVAFCVGGVLLVGRYGWRKGAQGAVGVLLVEYLFLLFYVSVLTRSSLAERSFNFTPFWSYSAIRKGTAGMLTQVVMNLVAFIPVGFLLGCAFPRLKWWQVLLIGGGFSLLIEVSQLVFKLGLAEFDDVFHNVLGCLVGYGVSLLISRNYRSV